MTIKTAALATCAALALAACATGAGARPTFEYGEDAYQREIALVTAGLPPKAAAGMAATCGAVASGAAPSAAVDVTPAPYDASASKVAPARVFDQLYFVGDKDVSVWALDTADGIILFDATHASLVEDRVIGGLRTLGLDPARIRYVVVTHGHDDHYGGAKLLQERYGARILMGTADWKVKPDPASKGAKEPLPRRDIAVGARRTLALGGVEVTIIPTPGHTPGTLSVLIPVTDQGEKHVAALVGGGFPFGSLPAMKTFATSIETFTASARDAGADVMISNHPKNDESMDKLRRLAARKPGEANPFVGGGKAVIGRAEMAGHCARAWVARNGK